MAKRFVFLFLFGCSGCRAPWFLTAAVKVSGGKASYIDSCCQGLGGGGWYWHLLSMFGVVGLGYWHLLSKLGFRIHLRFGIRCSGSAVFCRTPNQRFFLAAQTHLRKHNLITISQRTNALNENEPARTRQTQNKPISQINWTQSKTTQLSTPNQIENTLRESEQITHSNSKRTEQV